MREIFFRGKMDDNSRWVEGYYCQAFRWTGDKEPVPAIQEADCFMFRSIDPSTVGQYTGMKDRNGKRIFEGDVLRWDEREWGSPHTEVAKWDYELLNMRKNDWSEWCEIIGNIHDNPELLEELK